MIAGLCFGCLGGRCAFLKPFQSRLCRLFHLQCEATSLQQTQGASRGECRDTKLVDLIDEPSEMVCLTISIIRDDLDPCECNRDGGHCAHSCLMRALFVQELESVNSILDTTYINCTQLRQPSTVMPAALHAAGFTAAHLVRMNTADKANHHHQYVQTIACALGEPSLPTQLISC